MYSVDPVLALLPTIFRNVTSVTWLVTTVSSHKYSGQATPCFCGCHCHNCRLTLFKNISIDVETQIMTKLFCLLICNTNTQGEKRKNNNNNEEMVIIIIISGFKNLQKPFQIITITFGSSINHVKISFVDDLCLDFCATRSEVPSTFAVVVFHARIALAYPRRGVHLQKAALGRCYGQ